LKIEYTPRLISAKSKNIISNGVEDDGRTTGARARRGNLTDPLRPKAAIFNNTIPNLHVEIEIISIDRNPIIMIKIPRSDRPVCTASGLYVRRAIMETGKPGFL